MKTLKISETTMPRALIFSMKPLVDLNQGCSNYHPGAKNVLVGHMFSIGLYRENMKKSSCLKPRVLEP